MNHYALCDRITPNTEKSAMFACLLSEWATTHYDRSTVGHNWVMALRVNPKDTE